MILGLTVFFEPEWASKGPERADWRFVRVDLVHERADSRHGVDLGFERADLRANSLILGLREVVGQWPQRG